MKLHLPLTLRASLLAAACLFAAGADASTPSDDWGNTIYIGDSITHGHLKGGDSYRFPLFKIMVDNGIAQTEVGIQSGYNHNSNAVNLTYGTATFNNLHASQSGITANQVAGAGLTAKLNGSDLKDWLGLASTYTGTYKVHSAAEPNTLATPDTAFVMIGTNDIFGVNGIGNITLSTGNWEQHLDALKSHYSTIFADLKAANPDINIVLNAIPTWNENRTSSNGSADSHAARELLNAALKEWVEGSVDEQTGEQIGGLEGVTFVDINKGTINVANTSKPYAASSALCVDQQHPNNQGDLIIAGNIAQQLGYAGRTAGQQRVAATNEEVFTHQAANIFSAASTVTSNVSLSSGNGLELAQGATLSAAWAEADDLADGFTVDFGFANGLGNGDTDGTWNTSGHFALTVGDGTHAGTINVNEAYIKWGNSILYSMDTSGLTDSLRVAYVYGNASQGLNSGFYVWMGDMLIGEALSGSGTTDGISLTNGSGTELTLTHLSMAAGSWAPTTTLYTNGNPLIEAAEPLPAVEVSMTIPGTTSDNTQIRNNAIGEDGSTITEGAVAITVTGGTVKTSYLVGSQNAYTGDVSITLTGTIDSASGVTNKYNVLQYSDGELTGNISLLVDDKFTSSTTWGGFVGVDGGTVTGNVSMEFASSSLNVGNNTDAMSGLSVAGTRGKNIGGSVSLLFRAGTYNGIIYGGDMNPSSTGGVIIGGSTSVTLEGGTFKGNVYAGGCGGTIQQGASLTIGGAAKMESSVSLLTSGSIINGRVEKGSTLTVKDVREDSNFTTSYLNVSDKVLSGGTASTTSNGAGVSGTRTLRFDNVQISSIKATLQDFDALSLTGKSNVGLSSLGGATTLSIEAESRLALTGGSHTAIVNNSGTVAVEKGASLTVNGAGQDGNIFGTYEVNGGSLNITGYDHLSTAIHISSGSLSNSDGTILDGGVNVNATGAVALNGVALGNINTFAVQEGGSVSMTLDNVSLQLNADTQQAPIDKLMLGENGSLNAKTLTLNLDSTLSSNTADTGSLLVNQGSLNAGWVNIKLAEGSDADYRFISSGISRENGYSYVNYTKYAAAEELGGSTSFGNSDGEAIADLAITNTGKENGNIAVSTNGGKLSTKFLVANNNSWTGDIAVELGGNLERTADVGYNVAQFQGTLSGSMTQIIAEGFQVVDAYGNKVENAGTFVGANGSIITENLTMVFSSEELVASKSYASGNNCVIAGTVSGNVHGAVNIIVNAGDFTGNVYGGSANGNTYAKKGTNVTLNGGTIKGNVYGFGVNGEILENGSSVTVTGNATVKSATVGGSVTISAGGTGGSIAGGTLLTVQNATDKSNFVQNFNGTLSGNVGSNVTGDRVLCFDNTQVSHLNATLQNFDKVRLTNESAVTLEALGGATKLTVDAGSSLHLTGGSLSLQETVLAVGAANLEAETAGLIADNGLNLGSLTLDLSAEMCEWLVSPAVPMLLTQDDTEASATTFSSPTTTTLYLGKGVSATEVKLNLAEGYEGFTSEVSEIYQDAEGYNYVTVSLTPAAAIPEPATATLSLLALAGLAARRRRK